MKKKIFSTMLAAVMLLSGCSGKKSDPVVAKVGDTAITMSEFEFYLNSVKQQMQGTELSSDEDWENKEINGKKAIEAAKEQALEIAAKNIAYIDIYEKLGNSLDSEAREHIKTTKDNIVNQYENNGGYDEFLKASNISDKFVDMLCESMYCSDVLYNEFISDKQISDNEAHEYYDEHFEEYFENYRRAKHVLILTQDEATGEAFDDTKKAEAKKKADDIYKRAKSGEDFDALVSEYSEDPGSAANPEGYTFSDGEMVQEFQDCVDSLGYGEIGFTETSYGYHIIQRLEVDKGYFTEQIKSAILNEQFDDYVEDKMEEYGIAAAETEAINDALKSDKE